MSFFSIDLVLCASMNVSMMYAYVCISSFIGLDTINPATCSFQLVCSILILQVQCTFLSVGRISLNVDFFLLFSCSDYYGKMTGRAYTFFL